MSKWREVVTDLLLIALLLMGCVLAYVMSVWLLLLVTGGRNRGIIVLLALVGPFLLFRNVWGRWSAVREFRTTYGKRGKDLLIVLTDSPHWTPHIVNEWLPRWGARAVILNRSHQWNQESPEGKLWNAVKGSRDHTPLAVVVPRRGSIRVIRFFKAFTHVQQGENPALRKQEEILARALPS